MRSWLLLVLGLVAVNVMAQDVPPVAPAPVPPTVSPSPTPGPVVKPYQVAHVTPETGYTPELIYSAWPHISLFEAERLHTMGKKKGVLFVDARSEVEWNTGHIPRAVNVPLGEFDAAYA